LYQIPLSYTASSNAWKSHPKTFLVFLEKKKNRSFFTLLLNEHITQKIEMILQQN